MMTRRWRPGQKKCWRFLDVWPATKAAVKLKIDEEGQGWRKRRKEDDIRPKKQCHRKHGIQRDFILKNGMKFYKQKMIDRHQINGKGLHRGCFVADV